MEIAGYGTDASTRLRLWEAKAPSPLDMSLFPRASISSALEQHAMAEVIAKVLYPDGQPHEGKTLRLKQQYFFVSATVQSIVRKHIARLRHGCATSTKSTSSRSTTRTPTLVIPELMRVLLDDAGLDWDDGVEHHDALRRYTNHTVLSEALERWPQGLMQTPAAARVDDHHRDRAPLSAKSCEHRYGDEAKTRNWLIIWDGQVRMANLCIARGMTVNGVCALHSEILRSDVFHDASARSSPSSSPMSPTASTTAAGSRRSTRGCDALVRDARGRGSTTSCTPRRSQGWSALQTTPPC